MKSRFRRTTEPKNVFCPVKGGFGRMGIDNRYSVPFKYVNHKVWVKKYSDDIIIYDTDNASKQEIARHRHSFVEKDDVIDIQHYLDVLKIKPGALRNSYALRQTPLGIQNLFDSHFSSAPRDFVELLIWARDNKFDYQALCSAANVAKLKGVHDITAESIKCVLADNRHSGDLLDPPWTKSIEDGSMKNIASLNHMFNSAKDNAIS